MSLFLPSDADIAQLEFLATDEQYCTPEEREYFAEQLRGTLELRKRLESLLSGSNK